MERVVKGYNFSDIPSSNMVLVNRSPGRVVYCIARCYDEFNSLNYHPANSTNSAHRSLLLMEGDGCCDIEKIVKSIQFRSQLSLILYRHHRSPSIKMKRKC